MNYPSIFGNSAFFQNHPYALPCFVGALFPALGSLIGLIYLEEVSPPAQSMFHPDFHVTKPASNQTLPSRPTPSPPVEAAPSPNPHQVFTATTSTTIPTVIPPPVPASEESVDSKPPKLSALATKPVVSALVIYVGLLPRFLFSFLREKDTLADCRGFNSHALHIPVLPRPPNYRSRCTSGFSSFPLPPLTPLLDFPGLDSPLLLHPSFPRWPGFLRIRHWRRPQRVRDLLRRVSGFTIPLLAKEAWHSHAVQVFDALVSGNFLLFSCYELLCE